MPILTYNDCLSAYQEYPAPIRPYLLRAESHPTIRSQLTKSIMRVFIDLLARTPIADPGRPIAVYATGVAAKLGVSTKTVARTINVMANNDWLVQSHDHDGRNNLGEFSGREFIIGDQLRDLLGLPTEKALPATGTDNDEKSVDNSPKETNLSDGVYGVNKVFLKEASFRKGGEPKNPRIPADLISLHTELGISEHGVGALMREAKAAGQWLQDIWTAKRTQLLNAGATGGRAVSYIRYLLGCGEDFSYVARQKLDVPQSAQRPTKTAQIAPGCNSSAQVTPAEQRWRKYAHKRFSAGPGTVVHIFDGIAEIIRDRQCVGYIAGLDMEKVYDDIESGKLRAIIAN